MALQRPETSSMGLSGSLTWPTPRRSSSGSRKRAPNASKLEAPTYALARAGISTGQPVLLVEVLVKGSVVGVLAMRGGREKYECCTWSELERAATNPLPALIDEVVATIKVDN